MSDAPAPMTPADCDLRGMAYMPLLGERLFTSDFDAICNDSEWRAGLTLWWRSWQQVPCGSLPNDDAILARLAGYARDPRGWRKVRENALHGFVLCTDGRLYHPVIAELAAAAWTKRLTWRRQKRGQRGGQSEDVHDDVHPSVHVDTPADTPEDVHPTKGEGREIEEDSRRVTRSNGNHHDPGAEQAFEAFWQAYPSRDGNPKKPAKQRFLAILKQGKPPDPIIAGARHYAQAVAGKDPQYIAHATTWLNQERWNEYQKPGQVARRDDGFL